MVYFVETAVLYEEPLERRLLRALGVLVAAGIGSVLGLLLGLLLVVALELIMPDFLRVKIGPMPLLAALGFLIVFACCVAGLVVTPWRDRVGSRRADG